MTNEVKSLGDWWREHPQNETGGAYVQDYGDKLVVDGEFTLEEIRLVIAEFERRQ